MRMRGRIAYKLLVLLIASAIILITYRFYFIYNLNDEFLIQLSDEDDSSIQEYTSKIYDTTKLLNLTNFQYILENTLCHKYEKKFLAILIITSYVGHDELRAAHRMAISQDKLADMDMQRIFLLAKIPNTEHFINQQQLQDEQRRFGDLVQGNFLEAYRNLSYKHIMGLRWAATQCPQAKFIVKLDDDIVYDVFHLQRYLKSLDSKYAPSASASHLLAGYVIDTRSPIRLKVSKWYVSPDEYPASFYPAYLSGWMYITNSFTAMLLVNESQNVPVFWIDDTWVTGILRARINISLLKLNTWFSANAEFIDCCVRDLKRYSYKCEYYVGPNGGDNKLLIDFLHYAEKCHLNKCNKRPPERALKHTCVGSAKHIIPEHGEALIKEIKLR